MWVSRQEYERVRSDRSASADAFDRLLAQWEASQAEVKRLTDIIVTLKREGFHPPAAVEPLDLVGVDLDEPVQEAIAARDAGNPDLQRRLVNWAQQMKRRGIPDEEIREMIYVGGDPPEEME